MIIVMIIKVKKLLCLRQARIVFEPAEESQVHYTRVPVVQGREHEHNGDNDAYINPFRRVAKIIEEKTHDKYHRYGETITYIHCSLIKSRLWLEAYPTMRAGFIHNVEFGNLCCRVLENIAFTAARALTVKQRADVTAFGHSCWIYTTDILRQ